MFNPNLRSCSNPCTLTLEALRYPDETTNLLDPCFSGCHYFKVRTFDLDLFQGT